MSEGKSAPETSSSPSSPCFVCAEEAAALLNCVTEKKYNEMRCLPLIKKLRACVEKKARTSSNSAQLDLPGDCKRSNRISVEAMMTCADVPTLWPTRWPVTVRNSLLVQNSFHTGLVLMLLWSAGRCGF